MNIAATAAAMAQRTTGAQPTQYVCRWFGWQRRCHAPVCIGATSWRFQSKPVFGYDNTHYPLAARL